MSRVGKKPIELDPSVKVEEKDGQVTVSGPKGSLTFDLPGCVTAELDDKLCRLLCSADARDKASQALYGMSRAMIQNMVTGVTQGFRKELQIQGVGYRGQCKDNRVVLSLGYSHAVEFVPPQGVDITMPENTRIVVEGIDRQKVGQAAATIRGFRPPDNYKGKGIRYVGEFVALKEGKTVA